MLIISTSFCILKNPLCIKLLQNVKFVSVYSCDLEIKKPLLIYTSDHHLKVVFFFFSIDVHVDMLETTVLLFFIIVFFPSTGLLLKRRNKGIKQNSEPDIL